MKSTLAATETELHGRLLIFYACQLTLAPSKVIIGGYNLKVGSAKLKFDSFLLIEGDRIPVEGVTN